MEHHMNNEASWHGTQRERLDLLHAIARNCECELDDNGVQLQACASERMVISNQRALDGCCLVDT
jgi:hypothetical protein